MYIRTLSLHDFRNVAALELAFTPGVNVIQGVNGSGKTSLLEAIYYLSRGRSFRSATPGHLIAHDAACFVLHAVVAEESRMDVDLGIERSRSGTLRLRVGGEKVKGLSDVSEHLPTLFLDTDSHRTLASGPKVRRSLVDWGLFYGCQQGFIPIWQRYQRALSQRNGALKLHQGVDAFWDALLVEEGQALSAMREAYLEALQPHFAAMWHLCSGQDKTTPVLRYMRGWPMDLTLEEALLRNRERDRQQGTTLAGPHRADVKIHVDDHLAMHYLSQGQQKTLTYALALAQGQLLLVQTQKRCVYLLDDVCSELDEHHRTNILSVLKDLDAQIIATVIEQNGVWADVSGSVFQLDPNQAHCTLRA